MRQLAAVVLAAGASTRMGRPKALLEWQGRPFVAHAVALARAVGCDPVVVVVGAAVLPAWATAGASVVHNADWQDGQMSSVRAGLVAVPRDRAVLMLTVDRPHVRAQTIEALVAAWRTAPDCVWQPALEGRRGHPMLVPPDVAHAFVTAPAAENQRDVLARPDLAARRRVLPSDDPAVLQNLDRPEDLAQLPK